MKTNIGRVARAFAVSALVLDAAAVPAGAAPASPARTTTERRAEDTDNAHQLRARSNLEALCNFDPNAVPLDRHARENLERRARDLKQDLTSIRDAATRESSGKELLKRLPSCLHDAHQALAALAYKLLDPHAPDSNGAAIHDQAKEIARVHELEQVVLVNLKAAGTPLSLFGYSSGPEGENDPAVLNRKFHDYVSGIVRTIRATPPTTAEGPNGTACDVHKIAWQDSTLTFPEGGKKRTLRFRGGNSGALISLGDVLFGDLDGDGIEDALVPIDETDPHPPGLVSARAVAFRLDKQCKPLPLGETDLLYSPSFELGKGVLSAACVMPSGCEIHQQYGVREGKFVRLRNDDQCR